MVGRSSTRTGRLQSRTRRAPVARPRHYTSCMSDEQAIRDLIAGWQLATASGDVQKLMSFLADDVVFMTPGQEPFGKEAFAAGFSSALQNVRIDSSSEI